MSRKQPDELIKILMDPQIEFGDRDDAAMDLAAFDGEEVELALISVAKDLFTDPDLAETCGESLAEIWSRKPHIEVDNLLQLQESAFTIAVALMRSKRPEWENVLINVSRNRKNS